MLCTQLSFWSVGLPSRDQSTSPGNSVISVFRVDGIQLVKLGAGIGLASRFGGPGGLGDCSSDGVVSSSSCTVLCTTFPLTLRTSVFVWGKQQVTFFYKIIAQIKRSVAAQSGYTQWKTKGEVEGIHYSSNPQRELPQVGPRLSTT